MESAHLASIVGPVYLLLGLSVLFYIKPWKKFTMEFAKNHVSMLLGMLTFFILGLIMVNMYNIWDWSLNVIITVTGWALIIKGAFYFLAPGQWTMDIIKWKAGWNEGWYYFWSVVMIVVGGLLTHGAYLA